MTREIKELKEYLLKQCSNALQKRHDSITETLTQIKHSLQSETKSSAGDKHETGRAMLQLEREKTGMQLAEIEREQRILSKVSIENSNQYICLGSIVITSKANYFIAISTGKIEHHGLSYYAVSAAAPIAKLFMGKMAGDVVIFQQNRIEIEEVY